MMEEGEALAADPDEEIKAPEQAAAAEGVDAAEVQTANTATAAESRAAEPATALEAVTVEATEASSEDDTITMMGNGASASDTAALMKEPTADTVTAIDVAVVETAGGIDVPSVAEHGELLLHEGDAVAEYEELLLHEGDAASALVVESAERERRRKAVEALLGLPDTTPAESNPRPTQSRSDSYIPEQSLRPKPRLPSQPPSHLHSSSTSSSLAVEALLGVLAPSAAAPTDSRAHDSRARARVRAAAPRVSRPPTIRVSHRHLDCSSGLSDPRLEV